MNAATGARPDIVVLTGAGVSAESGIATFRDPDGIWARYDPEEVATPRGFRRNPAAVHAFYNERRRDLLSGAAKPNRAHEALARLESALPDRVLLVTQNVDDLHERAGSRDVLHMHGELLRAACVACGTTHRWPADLDLRTLAPCCGGKGTLRPDVVWFGEVPRGLDRIEAALRGCRRFAAIGTSGTVWPASGFIETVRRHASARTFELNLEPTTGSGLFDETILGPAGETVPRWVDRMIGDA